VIATQQRMLTDLVGSHLPPDTRVALVDFPHHNNCGDNAIWLGERALLDRLAVEVVYVAPRYSYDPALLRRRLGRRGKVLLHGGGNLGTVWPESQGFRETLVAEFQDLPIIQLPQTIHFSDPDALVRARRAFKRHPDLWILCRDEKSLGVAADDLAVQGALCPDPAFALGVRKRRREPIADILWLERTDVERAGRETWMGHAERVLVTDWLAGNPYDAWAERRARVTVQVRIASNALYKRARLIRQRVPPPPVLLDWLARRRLERGFDVLEAGKVVVTDRLHGHILSMLDGIPHVVLDNRYGKNRAYLEAFTLRSDLTHFAKSAREAVEIARGLVNH
jgi:exopolysaccharide biosynthesis predicted pyruvyltransferase EpsI